MKLVCGAPATVLYGLVIIIFLSLGGIGFSVVILLTAKSTAKPTGLIGPLWPTCDSGDQPIDYYEIEQNETTFYIAFHFTPASSKIKKIYFLDKKDVIDHILSNK